MSRCTSGSSNLRPISRFTEYTVLSGFVTACRLATVPTSRSPVLLIATTDGVIRPPSLFAMTTGSPASITATTLFVVPRSMPITFPILFVLLLDLDLAISSSAASDCASARSVSSMQRRVDCGRVGCSVSRRPRRRCTCSAPDCTSSAASDLRLTVSAASNRVVVPSCLVLLPSVAIRRRPPPSPAGSRGRRAGSPSARRR